MLTKYNFHDGSVIAIDHAGDEIRIAIESVKVCPDSLTGNLALTESGTIKGILKISGIRMFKVDGKKFKGRFDMRADSATILEFNMNESNVHFFVEWIDYPQSDLYGEFTDFIIEADTISWQNDLGIFDPYSLALIEEHFVVPLIILAAPSMKEKLADPLITLHGALAKLCGHVVENLKKGELDEFPQIFNLIERLHKEGEESVKEAATIDFLEGIQNSCSFPDAGIVSEAFLPYLLPESMRWWDALNDFWSGKNKSIRL